MQKVYRCGCRKCVWRHGICLTKQGLASIMKRYIVKDVDEEEYMNSAARETAHLLKEGFGNAVMEGSFRVGKPKAEGLVSIPA